MTRPITRTITIVALAGLSVGIFAAPLAAQSTSTSTLYEEGCLLPPTGLYKGLIDEVGVYNRALSAVEIRAIVNARTRGKCKPNGDSVTN